MRNQIEFSEKQHNRILEMSVETCTDGVVFEIERLYENEIIEESMLMSLTIDEAKFLVDMLSVW